MNRFLAICDAAVVLLAVTVILFTLSVNLIFALNRGRGTSVVVAAGRPAQPVGPPSNRSCAVPPP